MANRDVSHVFDTNTYPRHSAADHCFVCGEDVSDGPMSINLRRDFRDLGFDTIHIPEQADFCDPCVTAYWNELNRLTTLRGARLLGEESAWRGRAMSEIQEVISELTDKMWYNHHLVLRQKVEEGRETCDPQIWAGAIKCAEEMERKYGREALGPYPDFDWGMMLGKLSGLRWALGDDWETSLDN